MARTASPFVGLMLLGCTVTPIDTRHLADAKTQTYDAQAYVGRVWTTRVARALDQRAAPLATVDQAMAQSLPNAGARYGRAVPEGPPWTFAVRGEATVTGVDHSSRHGVAHVQSLDGTSTRLDIQIGPVITGSALRDALPSIDFNDFSDQIAFADVGRAINARALDQISATARALRPGDRVSFVGAFTIADAGDPLLLTPIFLQRQGQPV